MLIRIFYRYNGRKSGMTVNKFIEFAQKLVRLSEC